MKPDHRLIREYLVGSEEAFATLFDRHHPALYRFAYHLVGNVQEAEDLVQSTWVEVIRSARTYQGRSSFATWLHAIAYNLHRAQLRKRQVEVEPLSTELPGGAADPQQAAERAETARTVRSALGTLLPEHQEVLILHELQGFKYREIAVILGCPLGTVKSRLHYAIAALRAALTESHPDTEASHDMHACPAEP